MALTPASGPTIAPTLESAVSPDSTPALQPTAVPTLDPTTTPTPAPTLVPATIPTSEPDSDPAPSLRFYVNGVRIEFPPWVETSPDIARSMVISAVIAKARFLSIEPVIRETPHWGYVAEMVYRFQVSQYLKGEGPDGLVVNLSSGPKYQAFPDWLTMRGEEEARQLAEKWLAASLAMYDNQGDGILILRDVGPEQRYSFTHINTPSPGYGGYPVIGRTWLPEDKDSIYRIEFMRRKTPTISLSEFNDLIDDFRPLLEEQYGVCINLILGQVNRVRSQMRGTYRELTLGGWIEPKPFPRQVLTFDSQVQANTEIFRFTRPLQESPGFGAHWLEGKDKDLFAIDLHADADNFYESLRTVQTLPIGEYSVHFSKHERPLPCSYAPGPDDWPFRETVELVLNVMSPLGVDGE